MEFSSFASADKAEHEYDYSFFTDHFAPMRVQNDRCHSSSKILHNVQEQTPFGVYLLFLSKKQKLFSPQENNGAGRTYRQHRPKV